MINFCHMIVFFILLFLFQHFLIFSFFPARIHKTFSFPIFSHSSRLSLYAIGNFNQKRWQLRAGVMVVLLEIAFHSMNTMTFSFILLNTTWWVDIPDRGDCSQSSNLMLCFMLIWSSWNSVWSQVHLADASKCYLTLLLLSWWNRGHTSG